LSLSLNLYAGDEYVATFFSLFFFFFFHFLSYRFDRRRRYPHAFSPGGAGRETEAREGFSGYGACEHWSCMANRIKRIGAGCGLSNRG
ncbi:hypothetical protein LY78DRAFT_714018, partial [Colletotrichum sublineola]